MAVRGFVVSGRVQGVGFRSYVVDLADQLEVEGGVWNTGSGEVEIVGRHEHTAVLKEFEAGLWRGPGRVDNVIGTDGSPYSVGPGFGVWPTR